MKNRPASVLGIIRLILDPKGHMTAENKQSDNFFDKFNII